MNPGSEDLPAELADGVAEQLLATPRAQRPAALLALLAAHPGHADALRRLYADVGGAEQLLDAAYPHSTGNDPTSIGGHRVLRRLGEGAFGIVFLCQQERPVAREVAIKVLRPGAGDARTLQRFAAERQLLASLSHPAITHMFDAGELPDGRPFVVMEYVDGTPIGAFCERQALSCAARLRLFVEVCRGVAHAHSRGIVHRDLKPANVLIVDTADGPRPKIIDFGVAKALAVPDVRSERHTDAGRVIGTPGYMSPEQAAGRTAEVDVRTDVWALGVMLYELLTGSLPWPSTAASRTSELVRPSTRVSTTTTTATATTPTASARRQLAAELRGDLDWITLKALALARDERYATATALLQDVERHLRGEPVSVGPPSLAYRMRKRLRRHRGAFAWGVGCAVTLAAGAVTAWLLVGRVARSNEARLRVVADAVLRLERRANDAWANGAPDGVVRSILADALQLHDEELAKVPARDDFVALRIDVLTHLASTCFWLGRYREAIRFGEEAAAAADDVAARQPDAPLLEYRAIAAREIGRSQFMLDDFAAARIASERAASIYTELHAGDPLRYAMAFGGTLVDLGKACGQLGDGERHLAALQQALVVSESFVRERPDDEEGQRNLVRLHCAIANLLLHRDRLRDAEAALQQAAALLAASPRATDEERALVQYRLAKLYAAKAEPKLATAAGETALLLTEKLSLRNPDRHQLRTNTWLLRSLLCEQYTALRDDAAAVAHAEALATARIPDDRDAGIDFAQYLQQLAMEWIESGERTRLGCAEAWIARCLSLYAHPSASRASGKHNEAAILSGRVAGDLGRPWPADRLEALAKAPASPPTWAQEAWLLAARSHLAQFELAGARACLAEILPEALLGPDRLPRELMLLALAAGEPRDALAFARQCADANPSSSTMAFLGVGAWRAALQAERRGDAEMAADARDLAHDWCDGVRHGKGELDQLATVQARACLTLLTASSVEQIAPVVAALDEWRERSIASAWSEPLWCAAHLALAAADPAAMVALPAVLQQPRLAGEEIAIAGLCAGAPRGQPLALAALQRAVALGARDRDVLRSLSDLAPLRADPAFAALVAPASAK